MSHEVTAEVVVTRVDVGRVVVVGTEEVVRTELDEAAVELAVGVLLLVGNARLEVNESMTEPALELGMMVGDAREEE